MVDHRYQMLGWVNVHARAPYGIFVTVAKKEKNVKL